MSETTDLQTLYKFMGDLEKLKEFLEDAEETAEQRVFLEEQLQFAQETQQKLPETNEINKKCGLTEGKNAFLFVKKLEEKINAGEIHKEEIDQIMLLTCMSLLYGIYGYYKNRRSAYNNEFNPAKEQNDLERGLNNFDWVATQEENIAWYISSHYDHIEKIKTTPLLPKSVYYCYTVDNIRRRCGNPKPNNIATAISLLSHFYSWRSCNFYATEENRELQKFVNSLITKFKKYCPSVTINLYLKYNIHITQKHLKNKEFEGIDQKIQTLKSPLLTIQSTIPSDLFKTVRKMVGPER